MFTILLSLLMVYQAWGMESWWENFDLDVLSTKVTVSPSESFEDIVPEVPCFTCFTNDQCVPDLTKGSNLETSVDKQVVIAKKKTKSAHKVKKTKTKDKKQSTRGKIVEPLKGGMKEARNYWKDMKQNGVCPGCKTEITKKDINICAHIAKHFELKRVCEKCKYYFANVAGCLCHTFNDTCNGGDVLRKPYVKTKNKISTKR